MQRIVTLAEANSFFLFGARATGKTWLLHKRLAGKNATFIDLLSPRAYEQYSTRPELLSETVAALPTRGTHWIVIDEVQKVPALLDVVHQELEAHSRSQKGVTTERPRERTLYFALTGSSARKLKRGKANLLAGRAFLRELFPCTTSEVGESFSLSKQLQWGSLPGIVTAASDEARSELLSAYVHTYLREEILAEQLARDAPLFRKFLESAAQTNGEIVNFSAVARAAGVSANTAQNYYEILEDTLLAYRISAYHASIRKRQRVGPKFYFFDCGVTRALLGLHEQQILPNNYGYGRAFEHLVFLEMYRRAAYGGQNIRFSYLQTKDHLEIDFVLERPGRPLALVEIKSTDSVQSNHLRALRAVEKDFPGAERVVLSKESAARVVDGIRLLPWLQGIKELEID